MKAADKRRQDQPRAGQNGDHEGGQMKGNEGGEMKAGAAKSRPRQMKED